MLTGFHAHDGWFFERNPINGNVTVRKYEEPKEGSPLTTEAVFTPATWASICASVSELGENAATFGMFQALQRGF